MKAVGGDRDLTLDGRLMVIAPSRVRGEFAALKTPLDDLTGRLVRVRGRMHGDEIRLDHAEALELLRAP